MQKIIIVTAVLACASALPAFFIDHELLPFKSTLTQSNQLVDHGSTYIHTPIIPVVHHTVPVVHQISSAKSTLTKASQIVNHGGATAYHAPVVYSSLHHVAPSKTTVTKSNQVVNHGGSTLVHAPVLPVVHSSVYLHSTPLVSVKSGDSAVSHHSSTVHETVPVVNHLPLYTLHH